MGTRGRGVTARWCPRYRELIAAARALARPVVDVDDDDGGNDEPGDVARVDVRRNRTPGDGFLFYGGIVTAR